MQVIFGHLLLDGPSAASITAASTASEHRERKVTHVRRNNVHRKRQTNRSANLIIPLHAEIAVDTIQNGNNLIQPIVLRVECLNAIDASQVEAEKQNEHRYVDVLHPRDLHELRESLLVLGQLRFKERYLVEDHAHDSVDGGDEC